MKTIGVLSDTHLLKSDAVKLIEEIARTHFADVDMVLHAGDLLDIDLFENLFAGRPFVAVAGNMDPGKTQDRIPAKRTIKIEGVTIGLIHGNGAHLTPESLLEEFHGVNAIVYGHTHRPLCETRGDVLMLNPGSPIHPRGIAKGSVALLTVDGPKITGRIIFF